MDTLVIEVNCRPNGHDGPLQLGITVEAPYSVASQQRQQQQQQQQQQRQSNDVHEYRNHDYQNCHLPDLNNSKQQQAKGNHLNHNGSTNLHSRTPSTTPSSPLSSINRHHIGSIGEQIQRGLQITQIQEGSVIDKTGQFRIGDIIVEVNGVNLQRPTFQETHKILREYVKQSSHGPPLQLKVLRRTPSSSSSLPSTICSQATVIERSVDPPTTSSPEITNATLRKSHPKPAPSVSPQGSDGPRHLVEGYNTRRLGNKHRIRLTKGKDGFGIKIAERDNMFGANRPIYITAITTTGSAYRNGHLKEGDMLLEVNGINLSGKSQPEVTKMLKAVGIDETVEFVVSRQEILPHHDYHNLDDIHPLRAETNVKKTENGCDNDKSLIDLELPGQEARATDNQPGKKNDGFITAPVKLDGPGTYTYDIPLNDTNSAGLGLYLKYPALCGNDLGIWIEKVITGGAAWKDGRLLPDDQILAINGINLMGLSNAEASETLRAAVCRGIGPEATSNTIRLNIHRRSVSTLPKSLDIVSNTHQEAEQASGAQSWDEESIDNSTGEERFQRDGFGRRSISEKRHAQLMAKNTDTFRRNQKAREERARQRHLTEQLERQHISDEAHRQSLSVKPPSQPQMILNNSLTPVYGRQDRVGLTRNLSDRRSLGHRRDSFRAAVDRSYESSMADQVGVYYSGSEHLHQYQHQHQDQNQYTVCPF